MNSKKISHTRSTGTKLTPEQYAKVKAKADAKGLDLSAYTRQVLLSTSAQAETLNPIESLLHTQLEETQALRIIMLNLAGLQANGVPLTSELLEKVRERADGLKAERTQALLATNATNQSQFAISIKNEEATA